MYFVKSSHILENYGFTKFLHAVHTMEKREIFSHQNFSSNQRFSNLSLVKPLFTEFLATSVHYSVEIAEIHSHTFSQKFCESSGFTREITK